MKLHTLLFALTIGISSCFQPIYLNRPTATPRLTSLPTPLHSRKIDVFLENERPKEAYIPVSLLSRTSVESRNGKGYTVEKFIQDAQDLGADAIMLNATNTTSVSNPYDNADLDAAESHQALAIKYVKNIDYLENYLKERQVFGPSDSLIGKIEVGFDGLYAKTTCPPEIETVLHRFDLSQFFTEAQIKGLFANTINFRDETPWVRPSDQFSQTYSFRFTKGEDERRIALMDVRKQGNLKKSSTARFHYDKQGRCMLREIQLDGHTTLLEENTYNEQTGRRATATYYRLLPNNERALYCKVVDVFHSREDVDYFKSEIRD